MLAKLDAEKAKFIANINNVTASINKGKLILEETLPSEAI